MMYDRSLIRRILATLVDGTLALLVTSILVWPMAKSLDSPMRIDSGLFFMKSCNSGVAFTSPNVPFSLEGWDQIYICDQITNGIFPSRTANFYQETVSGKLKNFKTFAIPLNSKNEASWIFPADMLAVVILVFGAAAFEASKLRATPGKLLLGLEVTDERAGEITFLKTVLRNAIKYLYGVFMFLFTLSIYFKIYDPFSSSFKFGDPKVTFTMAAIGAAFILPIVFSILNLIDWLSILFPWHKAGRPLHDRFSKSYVIRRN
jgi:uncharacterized RDD family membrane protein YckC